jgi:hypothetical protein
MRALISRSISPASIAIASLLVRPLVRILQDRQFCAQIFAEHKLPGLNYDCGTRLAKDVY